ncbi:unnamed protein product [Nippostrongylus brasiliensis]|uniref:Mannosyltransferase n=1 Tax=Nippostrongylus brasiliensis TaxID=27835 RepID=A0A158R3Q6_NIPBR|nr:unnamed protein product [Nippostrongylus brasiliensis]
MDLEEKVFKTRRTAIQQRSHYALMTDERLDQTMEKMREEAQRFLSLVPLKEPRSQEVTILSRDSEISGFDNSKFVFTDITFDATDQDRVVVVREVDGTLRTATPEEHDRMNRVYYEKPNRPVFPPPVFEDPYLQAGFLNFYVLVQCVFDRVVEAGDFDVLHSTRHFGTLVFYLALNENIPPLLNYFGGRGRIRDCANLVRLQKTLYPDWRFAINSDDTDLKIVTDFVKQNARYRDQLSDLNAFLKDGTTLPSTSQGAEETKQRKEFTPKTTVDASNIRTTSGPLGELSQEYEVQLIKSEEELAKKAEEAPRRDRRGRLRKEPPKDTMKTPEISLDDIRCKLYVLREDLDFDWEPSGNAVLKLLFSLRLSAALWSNISDCDEVYNYWEPLHLMLFGKGLQTWEYSPLYAIRSYFYVYLHYIPANILFHLLPYSKIALFITLRCTIGVFTLLAEFALYKAACKHLSISIGRFFVLISMLSTGMFISSTAFLPSSFAMAMNMYAMAAFLNEKWFYAIFATAVSALVGWPFAAVLGLPIVAEMLILRPKYASSSLNIAFIRIFNYIFRWKMFWYYAAMSGILVCGSLLTVDSYYYGKRVLAPLNIVLYNVFSEHGPDLYGVEPLSYYLKNLALNWNLAAFLVPCAIPLSAINYLYSWKASAEHKKWGIPVHPTYWRHYSSLFLLFCSFSLWCMIFFVQPHKEERFLFPIYPLIALLAAVSLDSIERLVSRFLPSLSSISWVVLLGFVLASMSRTYALHRNFSAHIEVYKSLNEHLMDHQHQLDFSIRGDPLRVCVGKEWYRFPSSFFLPQMAVDARSRKRGVQLHFLKSEFAGLLPKYYPQGKIPFITRRIPTEMNDMNQEEMSRYVPLDTCDYLIDLETPDQTTDLEPNYGSMGILMDELDRGGREDVEVPKAVIGAESTKRRKAEAEANFQERIHSSDPGFVLAEQLRLAHEEAKAAKVANVSVKPQKEYGFESSIDNSTNPFVPKLRTKHHALPRKEVSGMIVIDENDGQKRNVGSNSAQNDVDDSSHPYTYEIQNFVVPDSQMESRPPVKPLDFKDTPLKMVKTKEDLELLRDTLNKCKEFAVDLEHHDFRSYLGITCLLQISTRTEDFIIDPFPLWNEMHILNEPFTDPAILKVPLIDFFNEHDIEWLQRDFGIYVVNMFDTGRAMRLLDMQKFNLRFLVHHYCDVLLDKKYQLADWRERPLDEEMINYARGDTHYLLYCYDRLREDLLEKGDQLKNLLRVLYSESAFICATVYRKPDLDKDGLRGLERRRFNNRQEAAVQVLWHWRDKVAREEDESVQYVLPNHMLLTIAETLPRELQGILHCCNPVPPLVRECVHDLHKMIFKCRDIPLVEYKDEVTTDTYEQLLRQINMRGQFTKENIFIMCPLDFSQTEFDEESGNLVSATKSENALSVAERPPTHTLLSVLDSATTLGKDEAAANPTAAEKVLQRLQATATPYENYTIAVTQAKKKEAEEKSKEADDVQVITKPEKRYTHHDPVATPPSVPTQLKVNEDDIDLTDAAGCAENSSTPRFDECQLRTRKEMKRARKQVGVV